MTQQLIAAVQLAACRIDSLASLAVVITDMIETARDTIDPAERLSRAADLARIAFDELQAVEQGLAEAQEAIAGSFPEH